MQPYNKLLYYLTLSLDVSGSLARATRVLYKSV